MSDSPPKTKSHYFVQKYDDENYRYCEFCGQKFKSNRPTQKYCCRACYLQGIKKTKAIWYQKNKKERDRKHYKWLEDHEQIKIREPTRRVRNKIVYKRGIIIKQQVLLKCLLTKQILSKQFKKEQCKLKFDRSDKKILDPARCEFIKMKLADKGLPLSERPVEIPDKYEIDLITNTYPMRYTDPSFIPPEAYPT